MRTLILGGVLAPLALFSAAKADFMVANAPPTAVAPGAASPADGAVPASVAPAGQSDTPSPAPARPAVRTLPIAAGFGDDVPLEFAVRQIVPHGVLVKYGPSITPATLVSWRGGRPWNLVLLAALRPAGLRLVMSRTTILIQK